MAAQAHWRNRPAGGGDLFQPQLGDRLAQHQDTDAAEEQHVDDVDGDIDLAKLLQEAEQDLADAGADKATGDKNGAHLHIDLAAPPIGQRAGYAGTGDLGRRGSDGNRRRDAVKDQQWCGEKPAANAEHAR